MGFDKVKIKQICGLMFLAAALILALIYSKELFGAIAIGFRILRPFITGAVIAFVLNLPMNLIEKRLLAKWNGKAAQKVKRPVSIVLSILLVLLIIILVLITVIPQLSKTFMVLGNKIPDFLDNVIIWLEQLSRDYPQLEEEVAKLAEIKIDWAQVWENILSFLKNGFGNALTSTFSVASGIIGGIADFVISVIFSLYILSQKEKLENQGRRILAAYLPERIEQKAEHILALLYRNFSKFVTGQCLEAVILGTMFVIVMTLFRMPYAVMVGVLIAFTALIPVVGAFIGCAVGTFLILIENPLQAFIFLIMFLVLQQLEGNLIYPRVVGNSVGLPSIWVLMAVSVGGSLFGVAGMLTFIPLLSTVYALLKESVDARNAGKVIECRAALEQKAEEAHGHEERKAEEKKTVEKKTVEKKNTEQKSPEHKSAEHKSAEHKSAEHKSTERKLTESKSAEQQMFHLKADKNRTSATSSKIIVDKRSQKKK